MHEVKKKDEENRREEEHQRPASRILSSADGGEGFLHRITKPAAWRGGLLVLEDLEEDAGPMRRCE